MSYIRLHTGKRVAQYFHDEASSSLVFNAMPSILKDSVIVRDMNLLPPFAEMGAMAEHEVTLTAWKEKSRV
jgi:hypothetical protein